MRRFDSVVIGAGPAGLSAAAALAPHGRCLLIESGASARARDRSAPTDLLSGVGGAGLFSDGKLSFFPSATALWQLPDARALSAACADTARLLARHGIDPGDGLSAWRTHTAPSAPSDGRWQPRPYPSVRASQGQRMAIIDDLSGSLDAPLARAHVVAARRDSGEIVLDLEGPDGAETLATRAVVVATGRWSPRWIRAWLAPLGVRFAFGRVEYGVRLEAAATSPLFARLPGLDGKLRLCDPARAVELRTFCLCRHGEVVVGESHGLRAFSGRADGVATDRSSVGLLVRTTEPDEGASVLSALDHSTPATLDLADWRARGPGALTPIFGPRGAAQLAWGLDRFADVWPELGDESVRVHAPVIEGVGDYPLDDGALWAAPGVWLAGDVGGRFRGIIAAMVSGRYVAARVVASGARR